jgi:predicted ATPase
MLKRISIAGWKSIKKQALELGPLNVIIGPNGAGKSSLLSFFHMLRAISKDEVARSVARAGGASALLHCGPKTTPEIKGEIDFTDERGAERYAFNRVQSLSCALLPGFFAVSGVQMDGRDGHR